MSLKAVSWAIEQDLNPTHKVILIVLASFMNDETGLCCPKRKRLAALVNVSEATLKRQLAQLEKMGIVVRAKRYSQATGLQTSNAYIINFKKGRRLKMSPLPQYDDEHFQEAQIEPAGNPGGSPVEPPGGSPVEPPRDSFKGNIKEDSAQARGASREYLSDEEKKERRHRLGLYRERGIWPPAWGTPPSKQELIDFEKEMANARILEARRKASRPMRADGMGRAVRQKQWNAPSRQNQH